MYDSAKDAIGEQQLEQLIKLQPLGLGRPVDVANVIAFLLSEAARWITGEAFVVDGGYLA
jgi:NAD(P)-dependent dehydrogenase (short-subunit alcohol dehydrogenase family)